MELNKLYNMDCMEGMKTFPNKYFDLAIVDPPYGINAHKFNLRTNCNKKFKAEFDNNIPDEHYFTEIQRISSGQIIWGGNYFTQYLEPNNKWIIWYKNNDGVSFSMAEMAWTSCVINTKVYEYRPMGKLNKIHPTQKPVQLYKWILHNYTKPDFKILDTHAGSCSSVIAFLDYGCDWIAFEIDKDYYEAASKRIENHKMQLRLNYEMVSED